MGSFALINNDDAADTNSTASDVEMTTTVTAFDDTKYHLTSTQLLGLVDSLREEGGHFELDLPTIVVCGNQSAGKSSVLEAISAVMFPRSKGTCTRCPFEVRLTTTGGAWACVVKLRKEYDDANRTKLVNVKEIPFGDAITDPELVEARLCQAQRALLNPRTTDPLVFLDNGEDEEEGSIQTNELKFTQNVVVVEIRGAEVNLTLIDLPGIIRSTERREDEKYIEMTLKLVKEYIAKSNAIIVATITCSDDVDNQEITRLAKEADPDGRRTVGVLTKPDRIAPGEQDEWQKILDGRRYPLRLGWYMVKNPTQEQLDNGITFAEAREGERDYFASDDAWAAYAQKGGRMGIKSLRDGLSQQLVQLINRELPKMIEVTETKLHELKPHLAALPPTPAGSPHAQLSNLANELQNQLSAIIKGAPGADKSFRKTVKAAFSTFFTAVLDTKPMFSFNKGHVPFSAGDVDGEMQQETMKAYSDRKVLQLEDVKQIIEEERVTELPGNIPYSALLRVIHQPQEAWEDLALACMAEVEVELVDVVETQLEEALPQFPTFFNLSRRVMRKVHNELLEDVKTHLKRILESEFSAELTGNSHYLISSQQAYATALKKELAKHKFNIDPLSQYRIPGVNEDEYASLQDNLTVIAAGLSSLSCFSGLKADDLFDLIKAHEDLEALELVSKSWAYFKLSARRFGDQVPLDINRHLLGEFSRRFYAELMEAAESHPDMSALMSEDPSKAQEREFLEGQYNRLSKIKASLANFEIGIMQ